MTRFRSTLLASLLCLAPAVPAQVVPSGFFDDLIVSGLTEPVGLAFLPDGRILVIEQRTANIKVRTASATATIGTVPGVNSLANERGLLGIAVDPMWPMRPYIYTYFTFTSPNNVRIAMFTVTGNLTDPTSTNLSIGSQFNILTDIPDNAGNHNGGTLRFGPDGMLYASIGDDANSCAAQQTNDLRGVILRLDVSALPQAGAGPPPKSLLIPPGNPFSGPTDNDRLTWAYGLRNPFRMHVDSVTGNLYIADVGQNAWEEYSEGTAGGLNFGWPWFEGNASFTGCGGPVPMTVFPIAVYPNSGGASVISFGGRYRNPAGPASFAFGPNYEGDVFYLDYFGGFVRRLKFNGTTWVTPPAVPGQPNATNWAIGYGNVADAVVGPDGAIYYTKQFPGSLRRLRQDPNAPVLTKFAGDNQPGNAGQALFDPLVVQVLSISGAPLANVPVTFSITQGGGTLGPQPVMTDPNGFASTTYTLSTSFTTVPVVTATTPGTTPATFQAVWRGLIVNYISFLNFLSATVRHSEPNSPLTIAIDAPSPVPYLNTPFGDIWTSILTPGPSLGVLDGLGLFFPANPALVTDPSSNWFQVFTVPPNGQTHTFQAYAIDMSLFPAPQSIMISNPVTLTLM